jgi:hypothetical protein
VPLCRAHRTPARSRRQEARRAVNPVQAARVSRRSRAEAEDRLQVARQEAAQIAAAAVRRLKDLDADTDRIWAERLRILEDARGLAGPLIALAQSANEPLPPPEPEVTAEPEAASP